MKRVSELYQKHAGEDIYVVGTGASLRVFPHSFLADKITIGLNMAWKWVPVKYGITIHPDLNIPELLGEQPPSTPPSTTWITGHEKCRGLLSPKKLDYAETHFHFFRYDGKKNSQPEWEPSDAGRVLSWVERPTEDFLYIWSSVSQAGVNLAANMGAKNIFLVGCDNGPLGVNHHAGPQHTRWKGVSPEYRYSQYREGLSEIRETLRHRGIPVLSLTPFLGLHSAEAEFTQMCREQGVEAALPGRDISPPARSRWKALLKKGLGLAGVTVGTR